MKSRIADEINSIDYFDAGILNDYGGGNIAWWQDYIRSLLNQANDYYIEQFIDKTSKFLSLTYDRWYVEEECDKWEGNINISYECGGCENLRESKITDGWFCYADRKTKRDATIDDILSGKAIKK